MADPSVFDSKVIIGMITTAFGVLATVIGVLWRRIDSTNAKCVEDRDKQNQERAKENKDWFERVERLYQERGTQTREMFDQVVKLAEKGKDSDHATINALVETGRVVAGVNDTLTSLSGKIDDLGKDLRLMYERSKDSAGR